MNKAFITIQGQGRNYTLAPNWQISFLSPIEASADYEVAENEMGYLGGPPLHIHPDQDETHYLLQGQLRYQIGEQTMELKAGDYIYIPRGMPHAWINLQPEPARIFSFISPGNSEGFFQTFAATTPLDPEVLIKLAQEYGTEVIGPPLTE